MNLDDGLKKVTEIASKLENPDLTIEEGLKLYEEGVIIAKDCLKQIEGVKGKINVIRKELDAYREEALD